MSLKNMLKKAFPVLYEGRVERLLTERIEHNKVLAPEDLIREEYVKHMGFRPNLEDPVRYTEKIQWRKLNDHDPLYSRLSDKVAVRDWVQGRIGAKYLIPLIGVWDSYDQIDFNYLPDEFVLKTNNASSTVCIVPDKKKMNHKLMKKKFDFWMQMDYTRLQGYESQYAGIKPKILAEFMVHPQDGESDLRDYKFLCFNGKVHYIWVDLNRYHGHARAMFDRDWNFQHWNQKFEPMESCDVERPANLDEMIMIAEKLAASFDHVRVDLYNTGNRILFGEMTFTNSSGFEPFYPDEWDYRLGNLWTIPNN